MDAAHAGLVKLTVKAKQNQHQHAAFTLVTTHKNLPTRYSQQINDTISADNIDYCRYELRVETEHNNYICQCVYMQFNN